MIVGMVHGRFQPFHSGHLEYVRGAAARCERLLVGITSQDRSHRDREETDPERALEHANPFTYTERADMIARVLEGERLQRALVVPFPVSRPGLWPDYVPVGTIHFLRVFDSWGTEKTERLRAAGHTVIVLDPGVEKRVTGTEVRRRLREGGDWRKLVPPEVAAVIDSLPEERARRLRRAA
jgi:cytidyltransferase-like protein